MHRIVMLRPNIWYPNAQKGMTKAEWVLLVFEIERTKLFCHFDSGEI